MKPVTDKYPEFKALMETTFSPKRNIDKETLEQFYENLRRSGIKEEELFFLTSIFFIKLFDGEYQGNGRSLQTNRDYAIRLYVQVFYEKFKDYEVLAKVSW